MQTPKKKTRILKSFIDYVPAELCDGKEWFIYYYVKNPATEKLHRKKIKINRIKSLSLRRKFAKKVIHEINIKLSEGWNPFLEEEAPKGYHTLVEAMESFMKDKRGSRADTLRTYASYIKILEHWLTYIRKKPDMYVISFTKREATDFLQFSFRRGIKASTYNNYKRFYNLLFRWMVEFNYCKVNPFAGLSKKKEAGKERILIPVPERNLIKEHLESEDYEYLLVCMMAFHCLLRPKEITYVRVCDISLEGQTIYVSANHSKNGKTRIATIANVMIDYIKKLDLPGMNQSQYLFSEGFIPGKTRMDPRKIAKRWEKLRNRLKLPKEMKFYSLRDSGIVQMLEDGIPPDVIMRLADHHSLEVTNEYVKLANPEGLSHIKNKSTAF